MSSLLTLAKDLEQKLKAQQQSTAGMLKTAFSEHEKSVKAELNESARRISAAISAHEQGMKEAMQSNRLNVLRMTGRMWLTITMCCLSQRAGAYCGTRGSASSRTWTYATGERGAERARIELEQAGAEFELADRLNVIEQRREHERALQHQKTLELERSQRQRSYDGPSLG